MIKYKCKIFGCNSVKRWPVFLCVALFCMLVACVGTACWGWQKINEPLSFVGDKKELYIRESDQYETVERMIDSLFTSRETIWIKRLAALKGYNQKIRAGHYDLSGCSSLQIVRTLVAGNQAPVRITFNNIRLKEELAGVLSEQLMIDSTEIMTLLNDSVMCATLGFSTVTIPAMFIPNTYEVYWTYSASQLLKRMKNEYERFWNKERTALADSLGLSLIEVTILASIVEEETKDRNEQPIVAGLYLNRLKRNMLLQADPTVKYSMLDFKITRILNEYLRIESPYNTYLHVGLPPGPIRIPSIQAIDAVLHHVKHNYLYMCAKEDFSGKHNFAVTLAEHNRNAARYRNELNRRKIR